MFVGSGHLLESCSGARHMSSAAKKSANRLANRARLNRMRADAKAPREAFEYIKANSKERKFVERFGSDVM